ncbi:CRP/FNR family transcriptional regulator, cyclic AMP receptor protein [Azospirillaceae bacterium]
MADQRPASLDRSALLASLDTERRAALARQCKWRRFQNGEQIFDRSSDTHDLCFVVEGTVRVVNHSLSGREISFDDVEAGGFFGELSAIDGEPRSASVVALNDTLIAFLAPARFEELVLAYPRVGLLVMKRLTGMVRRSTERIMDLSTLGANNRIHAELLRLARPTGGPRENTAIISPIPVHSDIASRVSTTRETVARVLSDLTRDDLLERRDNALVIRDLRRLHQMVDDVRGN